LGGATAVLLLLAALITGCGSSTITATEAASGQAAPAPSPDGELLDKVLARQEGAVAAYTEVIPHLSPRFAHMASYFRAQEQEHVDATIKALRGLDAPAEATPEPVEPGELKSERERLLFLYELEGSTIDEELSAISKLEAAWPLAARLDRREPGPAPDPAAAGARRRTARLGPRPVRGRDRTAARIGGPGGNAGKSCACRSSRSSSAADSAHVNDRWFRNTARR
jgi:hypothetical protein